MSCEVELVAIGPYQPDLLTILDQFGSADPYDRTPIGTPVLATLFHTDITSRARELMDSLGVHQRESATFHIQATRINWADLTQFANETDVHDDLHALQRLLHNGFTILCHLR